MGTEVQLEKGSRASQAQPPGAPSSHDKPNHNTFEPIPANSVCYPSSSPATSLLALTTFLGIITGIGLCFALKEADNHRVDSGVISSASSKVALGLALYLKYNKAGKMVIGFTSDSNRDFVELSKFYDMGYEDILPDNVSGDVIVAYRKDWELSTIGMSLIRK